MTGRGDLAGLGRSLATPILRTGGLSPPVRLS
jgi:hypothetical protein